MIKFLKIIGFLGIKERVKVGRELCMAMKG